MTASSPYADPETAARKLIEIAKGFGSVQDDRIFVEKISMAFRSDFGGSQTEYRAGLEVALAYGWLWRDESATFVMLTEAGRNL